jgi:hypothetical protein
MTRAYAGSGPGCWPMSRARLVSHADDAEQGRVGVAAGAVVEVNLRDIRRERRWCRLKTDLRKPVTVREKHSRTDPG